MARSHDVVRRGAIGLIVALFLGSPVLAAAAKGDAIGPLRFEDESGRPISLETPGVLYLVDFWASGCRPCIAEMPDLERLASEYEPSGRFQLVRVLGGGISGTSLVKAAELAGARPPVYADPDDWQGKLDVSAYPTKLLVRDGTVLNRVRGGGTGAYQRWKTEIERELNAAPAAAEP